MTDAVRVGHIDLSFHDAAAREVERILREHGHRIARSAAPHEEMFRRLGNGAIDLLVSAWLPASHGAGISRFSAAIVEQYGLAAAGYTFATGTEAQCFGRYVAAVADRRWVVVPLWQPHWLHHRYRIRELKEPRGLLGGTDATTLIVRKDAEQRIGAAALAELATLHLGNARVSELDDLLQR
ncbi:hypothetical protein A9X01_03880 [Mycobacterium asiaticum]|uniref:ABC-type glycine betaine transport system substrate-binding domain-containing protein n=1 Tax=Mycobacterium asiaticum TaxID=1790 RepID=A0A1A3BQP8_MYCAS|nr:hypothetical protein A9X01_03880 [Mycobacterium asiaticum]